METLGLKVRLRLHPDGRLCFFFQAVESLKMFEKKDSRVKSAAATNLSFLYFLVNNGSVVPCSSPPLGEHCVCLNPNKQLFNLN
jgi:hypothetical protein